MFQFKSERIPVVEGAQRALNNSQENQLCRRSTLQHLIPLSLFPHLHPVPRVDMSSKAVKAGNLSQAKKKEMAVVQLRDSYSEAQLRAHHKEKADVVAQLQVLCAD